jgi:hypothetical protein
VQSNALLTVLSLVASLLAEQTTDKHGMKAMRKERSILGSVKRRTLLCATAVAREEMNTEFWKESYWTGSGYSPAFRTRQYGDLRRKSRTNV